MHTQMLPLKLHCSWSEDIRSYSGIKLPVLKMQEVVLHFTISICDTTFIHVGDGFGNPGFWYAH